MAHDELHIISESSDRVGSRKIVKHKIKKHSTSNPVYGLGMIGAGIYYISTATGFWAGAWGIIKAIFWPAFMVYELLMYLGA